MCGIVGFIGDLEGNEFKLKDGLEAIARRGPDAEGLWTDLNLGLSLGHRRLSIIDTNERANQPMFSHDKRFLIVFNGEIYNYREILNALHYQPNTSSDTEIIMEAYRKYGKDCVKHFNGMFAFLLYDFEKKELFLARDPMGKKPLYYSKQNDGFYFGSELKALTNLSSLAHEKKNIDLEAISHYLHVGFVPEPFSIYTNIKKFPAAHLAYIRNGELIPERYYDLKSEFDNHEFDYSNAHQTFDTLLEKAVKYRLIADVPYGSLLSGGIDSSLVSYYASKLVSQKIKTFTIGFKDKSKDESKFAADVAKAIDSEHYECILSETDALEKVALIPNVYDEPFIDSSAIPTLLVSELAAKHVKMVLTGDGGDEMFLGYGAYNWAKRFQSGLLRNSRHLISTLLKLGDDHKKRAADVFAFKGGGLQNHIFSQEQYLFSNERLKKILKSDAYRVPNFDSFASSGIKAQNYFDLKYYLKDDLLVKTDRASMYYGLEMRSPLLDKSIVTFALGMPLNMRMEGGVLKGFLKNQLYTKLPKSLFDRPKQGFSVPLNTWLKKDLNFLVEKYLSKEYLENAGIWNVTEILAMVQEWKHGANRHYNRIWTIIQVQIFLEKNG